MVRNAFRHCSVSALDFREIPIRMRVVSCIVRPANDKASAAVHLRQQPASWCRFPFAARRTDSPGIREGRHLRRIPSARRLEYRGSFRRPRWSRRNVGHNPWLCQLLGSSADAVDCAAASGRSRVSHRTGQLSHGFRVFEGGKIEATNVLRAG